MVLNMPLTPKATMARSKIATSTEILVLIFQSRKLMEPPCSLDLITVFPGWLERHG
jgi:hypothetical protein